MKKYRLRELSKIILVYILIASYCDVKANPFEYTHKNFPKILGMNIGRKHYNQESYIKDLSKNHVIILGFYRGWENHGKMSLEKVTEKIRKYNRDILIGQYTILNEFTNDLTDQAKKDIIEKLTKENWWLLNSKKEKLQWTKKYSAYEVNFTEFTKTDNEGRRFPEWLAERNFNVFFKKNIFDIWYIDNLFYTPRVKEADWRNQNIDEKSSNDDIQKAFRRGFTNYLKKAQDLCKNCLFLANADNDLSYEEYRNRFHGVFLEGLMGYSWSLERWAGWHEMMKRYHSVFENLLEPKIVGFHVIGQPKDKQFFRYAFTSCLLNDGYFSFTDINNEYSSVVWFEEYNFNLGQPIDKPQIKPWKENLYRRVYENGVVYVNPGPSPVIIDLEANFTILVNQLEEGVNKIKNLNKVKIEPKDGIIMKRVK